MIDVAEVLEVVQRDHAVFLRVALRHHQAHDAALEGLVRWCPSESGPGHGRWWVPAVGADVLCAFPGIGPDGRAQNLDDGFAWATVSSLPEPVQQGLNGPLAGVPREDADPPDPVARRVYRSRLGEVQDDHLQGPHFEQIDGPQSQRLLSTRATTVDGAETRLFKQTRSVTTQGDEVRHNEADFSETIEGGRELTVEGDETRETQGDRATTVGGNETRTNQGDLEVGVAGAESRTTMGLFDWLFNAAATWTGNALLKILSSAEVQIGGSVVRLGDIAANKKLVHEDFITNFNAHTHSGVQVGSGTTGPVAAGAGVIGVHTTTKARGDG